MAMQRANTRNIVVVMSDIPSSSTEWDLSCKYRDKGIAGIGSHYVVLGNGDVVKGRDVNEHGNVNPQFNKDSVYIEVMGVTASDITPHQKTTIEGCISLLEERFDAAELLPLIY